MGAQIGFLGALAGFTLGMAWWAAEVDVRGDPPVVICAGGWVTGCARVPGGLSLTVRKAPDTVFSFGGPMSEAALGYAVRCAASPTPLAMGEGTAVPLSQWPQAETVTFYALSGAPDWAEVSSVTAAKAEVPHPSRGARAVRRMGGEGDGADEEEAWGYLVTMTPMSECGGAYELFGLWPYGGSTRVKSFEFNQEHRYWADPQNAFTLDIEGELRLDSPAFVTFQIAADDSAQFRVGHLTFSAGGEGEAFQAGKEVSGILGAGTHPIRGHYVNLGEEARLEVLKWKVMPLKALFDVEQKDVKVPWASGETVVAFSLHDSDERVEYEVIPAGGTTLPDWAWVEETAGIRIDRQRFLERRVDSATFALALRQTHRGFSVVSPPVTVRVWREPLEAAIRVDANNDGMFDEATPKTFLRFWKKEVGQKGYQRLLDFPPFLLSLKADFVRQLNLEGAPKTFRVFLRSNAVPLNVLWTGMEGAYEPFYRSDVTTCGPTLDAQATTFPVQAVTAGGLDIPLAFLRKAQASGGILMAEALEQGVGLMELAVRFAGSEVDVFAANVTFQALPVDAMFVKVNLRGPEPPTVTSPESLPGNAKGATCALYFLHGFSVNESDALAWQKEMFRRLYRKNCRALFYGVTWEGDRGAAGMDYHASAAHAFVTGERLAAYVKAQDAASEAFAPTNNVFMAHSLGNMVVATAIQDHGMSPEKVIMLNAAIPSEAINEATFNTEAQGNGMVPAAWQTYDAGTWCPCWHRLFTGSGRPQGKLTWKNRFSKLNDCDILNLHSTGDEVLEVNEREPSVWDDGGNLAWHAWQAQELGKGKGGMYGSRVAGWEFRGDAPPRRSPTRSHGRNCGTTPYLGWTHG